MHDSVYGSTRNSHPKLHGGSNKLVEGVTVEPMTAGWYADPAGQGQRYWDGAAWTGHAVQQVAPRDHIVVTGPNHVLHAILTFLTFWACGGWGWVWLVIALNNRKHVTRY